MFVVLLFIVLLLRGQVEWPAVKKARPQSVRLCRVYVFMFANDCWEISELSTGGFRVSR